MKIKTENCIAKMSNGNCNSKQKHLSQGNNQEKIINKINNKLKELFMDL